jgi:FkbM family methyltransferase
MTCRTINMETKRDLIFDVGCHNGEDSEFYLRKGFRVVGIEANPSLCDELRRRFATQVASGQFILVESAIAEASGKIEFFINTTATIWGTIRSDWAERDPEHIRKIVVPAITFPSLIQAYGVPYYLKIDIEGADMLCLEGLLPFQERPNFVSFESDRRSIPALRAEVDLLKRLGYTKFQLVDQKRVCEQTEPFPAREGTYSNSRIVYGSSGLFGYELPGRWLSTHQFIGKYLQVMTRDRLAGAARRLSMPNLLRGSWYDIHAAL